MTIATSPTTPVAGSAVTPTSSLDVGIAAEATVIEIVSVPSASALSLGYVLTNSAITVKSSIDAAQKLNAASSFTPDVPGEYGVRLYLVRRLPQDNGAPDRWTLKTTDTGTIDVGSYAYLPLVTSRGDGGTLRLTIVGSTIAAAAIVESTTELARVAALQATVTDALTAMESTTVATALGVFTDRVADLRDEYEDHAVSSTWHVNADTDNVPTLGIPTSQDAAIAALNEIRDLLAPHVNSATYHKAGDGASVPIARAATSLASATVLLSDLRERCYERHRVKGTAATPQIHDNDAGGDATNALTDPTVLDDVIVAYFDALVSADPSVAAGEPEGLIDAVHSAGFELR